MKKIKNLAYIINILFVFGLLISNLNPVNAEVSTASTPVLANTSSGSASGCYQGVDRSSDFFTLNGYIYATGVHANDGYMTYGRTLSSGNNGTTWNYASGTFLINRIGSNSGGKIFNSWVFDNSNNYFHVASFYNDNNAPYELDYNNYKIIIDGTIGINSASGGNTTQLVTPSIHYGYPSTAMCIQDGKPIVASFGYYSTSVYLDVFFSSVSVPNNIANWTRVSYNVGAVLGNNYLIPHVHAVNSTHVLIIAECVTADTPIYGMYADNSQIYTPFTITTDSVAYAPDSNNYAHQVVATYSENIVNSSAYASEIAISYVNTSSFVKFGILNITDNTFSSESVYEDTGYNEPSHTSLAKVQDSYFIGFVGNNTIGGNFTFAISERDIDTYSWNTTKIKDFYVNWSGNPNKIYNYGVQMSKSAIFGERLYVEYLDSKATYIFYVNVTGYSLPEPPPPETPPDYNSLFFYAGIFAIILIFMGLVITKKKIGV